MSDEYHDMSKCFAPLLKLLRETGGGEMQAVIRDGEDRPRGVLIVMHDDPDVLQAKLDALQAVDDQEWEADDEVDGSEEARA